MFVASNRNRSPMEHSRAAVEHIHHANPSEIRLGPTRCALGTRGDHQPCPAQWYGELPLPTARIPTLPQSCQTLGGALEQRAAWASSGHGKKWFLIHFQVLSSGFKSRRLDAATSHKCLQARQQAEPHHVPPTLLLAVLVPQTLRGGRQSRGHVRSCLLHASRRTCPAHHTEDTPVSPGCSSVPATC